MKKEKNLTGDDGWTMTMRETEFDNIVEISVFENGKLVFYFNDYPVIVHTLHEKDYHGCMECRKRFCNAVNIYDFFFDTFEDFEDAIFSFYNDDAVGYNHSA